MLESTLKFIRCPKCNSNLNIEIYKNSNEIDEGILKCEKCQLKFPIIDKIPIMFIDFKKYISEHKILSGKLYKLASSNEIKKFLKLSWNNLIWNKIDKTKIEERWAQIYHTNKNNKFYKQWYCCNDSQVTEITNEEALTSQNAYILFYNF